MQVRAQHTTTTRVLVRLKPGQPQSLLTMIGPARPGDGHLVHDGRSLCGRDAQDWKLVTGATWGRLGEYRCPACLREAEAQHVTPLQPTRGAVTRRLS